MNKLTVIGIGIAVALAAGNAAAQPQCPPPPGGQDGEMMPPPPGPPPLEFMIVQLADQLGLTADQVATITGILDGARADMEALHHAVGDALHGGSVADFLAADRAVAERHAAILAGILAVLTDAQWRALQQLLPPPPPPPPARQ